MSNPGDANDPVVGAQLVDDPVGADSQGSQAAEAPAQFVSGVRLSLQQAERLLDRVDQRPVELEKCLASAPRENNGRHALPAGAALSQLAAKFIKRDRLTRGELFEAVLDLRECDGVRQDLGGLL